MLSLTWDTFFLLKMVTYVPNRLTKFTKTVDIGVPGFNAQCMRPRRCSLHYKHVVHAFATNLLRLSESGLGAQCICDWEKPRST